MSFYVTKSELEAEWEAACRILPVTVWLRNVGDGDDDCWVPCAKGDPGAVLFEPVGGLPTPDVTSPERRSGET